MISCDADYLQRMAKIMSLKRILKKRCVELWK